MIDISCKNLLPKECRDICILHLLAEAITRHQKLRQTCRESPTVALSYHLKIRFINFRSNFCR